MRLSTGCLLAALALLALASICFGGGGGGHAISVTPAYTPAAVSDAASREPARRHRGAPIARGGDAASVPTSPAVATTVKSAQLDGSLEAALHAAAPHGPGFVMLSFANSALNDHLINFVAFATRSAAPFVIGAVDRAAFTLLSARPDAPAYLTPLATDGFSLDGSNQHSSGSWKRFAGMRTGEVARVVNMGYSVMHTDIDVIWLRSPEPYLMCDGLAAGDSGEHAPGARFACGPLLAADVAVSSDNMSPGRDTEGRAAYSAGGTFNTGLLFLRPTPRGRQFASEWHSNVVSPPHGSRFAPLTSDQQVFNHMMRKPGWPGVQADQGAAVMREAWGGRVTLAALPMALFMNGHGYFVQRAHLRLRVAPYAAHATYSLDNHDGVAKRQRFRESGLWLADPPSYAQGKFLALAPSSPPRVQDRLAHYAGVGIAPTNIDTHARALEEYVAELRDALALALALGRTLVLPRWTCYCDRLWSGSDDIFHFGCMYPGSQDGNFVPFGCPMDHVLSPVAWEREKLAYRDPIFLDQPQFRAAGAVRNLSLVERPGGAGASAPPGTLFLGSSTDEARAALAAVANVPVLRLPHARGLLCSVDDPDSFNAMAARVLSVPSWCAKCFQPCEQELAKWLPADEIKRGAQWGQSFCLPQRPLPKFQRGACSLNTLQR